MDSLNILLSMGFKEPDARAAMESHSSVDGAVEHLMNGAGAAGAAVAEAASAIAVAMGPAAAGAAAAGGFVAAAAVGAGGRLGERISSWWEAAGWPDTSKEDVDHLPIDCLVEYHSKTKDIWIPAKVESFDAATKTYRLDVKLEAEPERVRLRRDASGLLAQLIDMGFSEKEASMAAKRCSSMEAALNWIQVNSRS